MRSYPGYHRREILRSFLISVQFHIDKFEGEAAQKASLGISPEGEAKNLKTAVQFSTKLAQFIETI